MIQPYTSGTINNEATVEHARPPMTARPSGADSSPASPMPVAIGIIPTIIDNVVIMIGLNRMLAATDAALKGSLYSCRKCSALVTINTALATDVPVDMINPIYDCK